jgi:hypothetical protein
VLLNLLGVDSRSGRGFKTIALIQGAFGEIIAEKRYDYLNSSSEGKCFQTSGETKRIKYSLWLRCEIRRESWTEIRDVKQELRNLGLAIEVVCIPLRFGDAPHNAPTSSLRRVSPQLSLSQQKHKPPQRSFGIAS